MKIDHLAIWTTDLEATKTFYQTYFNASSNDQYYNPNKNFRSYFLNFETASTRIELMHRTAISPVTGERDLRQGLAHFAISVGSQEAVDTLTDQLRQDGHRIFGEPRTTGDGYYESVVLDPEGNFIEITV